MIVDNLEMYVVISFYVCTLIDSGMHDCLEVAMNACLGTVGELVCSIVKCLTINERCMKNTGW